MYLVVEATDDGVALTGFVLADGTDRQVAVHRRTAAPRPGVTLDPDALT